MKINTPNRFIVTLLIAAAILGLAQNAMAKRKVIIDQDTDGPGGPNLQPILMLLQAEDVEVLGITVESGDGWQQESCAHALRMLELVGRTDVPVISGATHPLINSKERVERWEALYGKIPYKGVWMEEWPEYNTMDRKAFHPADVVPPLSEGDPSTKVLDETAAEFLVRKVNEFPGDVTVIALGPVTNIALAAKLDESFGSKAKELVFMGAGFNPPVYEKNEFTMQVVHSPRHEFNTRWDPEAAFIMLRAGWPKITIVPTDPTTNTRISQELIDRATNSQTPVAEYLGKYAIPDFPMWDELAVGVWLRPDLVTETERLAIDVDVIFGPSYGATLSWTTGNGPGLGEPDVDAVMEVDEAKLHELFVELISSP